MAVRISSCLSGRLIAAVLLCLLGALPLRAQTNEDDEEDATTEEQTPELTAADSLLAASREFHPELRSKYSVNKTNTTWDQGARLSQLLGPVELTTNWTRSIGRNKAQNDRRQRSTRGQNQLAYEAGDFGGWLLGTNVDLSRSSSSTTFNRQINDADALGVFVTSQGLGVPLRRLFGLGEETLTWEVTGTLGANRATSVNESRSPASRALIRADSTSTEGVARDLDAIFHFSPIQVLSFDVNASTHRGDDDFRTERPLQPDSARVLRGSNVNDADLFTASGLLDLSRETSFRFDISSSRITAQEYSTSEGTQDTRDGRDDKVSFNAKAEPLWGVKFDVTASVQDFRTKYQVSDRGLGSDNQGLVGKVKFALGDGFGFLASTEFEGDAKISSNRRVYDNATNYDEDGTNLSTLLKRTFTDRLRGTLKFEGDLTQTFYDAVGDRAQRLDRDVLRRTIDSNWIFDLRSDVETQLTLQWNERQTINVASGKSNTNEDATEYRVIASYSWSVWPTTKISQSYRVTANSSTFAFDEDRSNLNRESGLDTDIESAIANRARVRLSHEFKFRDSGAFFTERIGEPRRYAKDNDVNQQILEGEVNYRVVDQLDLNFRQKYDVQQTEDVAKKSIATRRILESFWGANLRHDFDQNFALTVRFDRGSSTREPSYWLGSAEVSRTF